MSGTLPPLYELTADDRGAIVVVVGFVFVLVTILFTVIRAVMVVILKRGWAWDDFCVVAGTMLALIQTILAERAANSGLGRHLANLDAAEIDSYYKFTYACQVLAVVVMALAKVSVLLLMLRLSPQQHLRRASYVTMAAVAAWTVVSVLALALQCGLPEPWVYSTDRCSIRGALWYPVVALNVLTDLAVALLFMPVILRLQMPPVQRLTVCLLFGSRIIVCGVGVAHLVILPSALRARDQTWEALRVAVLVQVTMTLSIITAVIPSLSRFFSELQTGSDARLPESQYNSSSDPSYSRTYELSNLTRTNGKRTEPRTNSSLLGRERTSAHNGIPDLNSIDRTMLHGWEGSHETEDTMTQRSDNSRTELSP